MKTVRCAIYTRKSSEEGLEQDFNSLDAQRESCAAYVLSQASKGWKLLPEHYDDGGLSGGSLERPALQRLLDDVRSGTIDIIVVYKVDRLTRSLFDFAKLVETFDAAEVSFVSVTQSFNTTTSMGRLTLNMLLSFAQFEREVTAERIRDKIAASKAKGMWMGGVPPLGYEPDGRSLKIIPEHARMIEQIYSLYLDLGNVRLVAEHLYAAGIRSPIRSTATGKQYGGASLSNGQLYSILKNPVYVGKIGHKDKVYPGNHPPIISEEDWNAVQARLKSNTQGIRRKREQSRALLAGLIFDDQGIPLQPVHATKGPRRYRYYISTSDNQIGEQPRSPALRIPAPEIEGLVRKELPSLLEDPLSLAAMAGIVVDPSRLETAHAALKEFRNGSGKADQNAVRKFVAKVSIHPDRVVLALDEAAIARAFGLEADAGTTTMITHPIMVRVKRSGLAMKLISSTGAHPLESKPDEALIRLIIQARSWWARLTDGTTDIATLAREGGLSASWITRMVRLSFLAPDVLDAVLAGKTKANVSAKGLLASEGIPAHWGHQAEKLIAAQS